LARRISRPFWLATTIDLLDAVRPPATEAQRAAVLGANAVTLYRL